MKKAKDSTIFRGLLGLLIFLIPSIVLIFYIATSKPIAETRAERKVYKVEVYMHEGHQYLLALKTADYGGIDIEHSASCSAKHLINMK